MQVYVSTKARIQPSIVSLWLILALALVANSGCLRRRMTVRTNPAGAQVYVDRQLIGTSPASTSFLYYGTRHIEVVADGYRTEKVLRKLSPPWYQLPPLDFITETLWPGEIRDERIIDITMVPEQPVASEELNARANTLRLQAAQGMATGLPPTVINNPNVSSVQPGAVYPTQPIPTQPAPNEGPVLPPWRPGQFLRNFFQPGGEPVQRIPETSGSYRPSLGS
jgi:PEGA domain